MSSSLGSSSIKGTVNAAARLERIPIGRPHIVWIAIIGIAYFIETYDNTVFAYTAPTIRKEWGLSISQVGLLTSAVFVGMMIGAVAGGRISDRYGRKPLLIGASIFYSATSLLSAVSPNFEVLFASRVLTGIGVQAATGVLMVYISEMFPATSRGRFFAVMTSSGYIAGPATSMLALMIAPSGVGAWRWLFVIGSAGLVVAVGAYIWLPESVRWLVAKGRQQDSLAVVVRMEKKCLSSGRSLDAPVPLAEPREVSIRELFSNVYRRRLVLLSSTFCIYIFCFYAFVSWVPTVLVESGMSQSEALRIATITTFGGVTGSLLLFTVADFIERKIAIFAELSVAGLAFVVFGQASSSTTLAVTGFVATTALAASATSLYTYISEVFPTDLRGVAAGTVSGIGRIGGVASGVSVASLYSSFGFSTVYLIMGIGMAVVGVTILAMGPKTTGISVEEIA